MKEVINTTLAPAAIGTYSQAVRVNNTVYCSGQIGLDPKSMTLQNYTLDAEIHQMFTNLTHVISAAGGDADGVVKLTIYLIDMQDFQKVNEIMQEYFQEPYPARACVAVKGLPKDARVEVEAILVVA